MAIRESGGSYTSVLQSKVSRCHIWDTVSKIQFPIWNSKDKKGWSSKFWILLNKNKRNVKCHIIFLQHLSAVFIPFINNITKWSNTLANAARFLKCVWPFCHVAHLKCLKLHKRHSYQGILMIKLTIEICAGWKITKKY